MLRSGGRCFVGIRSKKVAGRRAEQSLWLLYSSLCSWIS